MGVKSTLHKLVRRRRPLLSVVLLADAGAHVDRAVRSLLNQRPGDTEILAIITRECPADEQTALMTLARRNRSIRIVDGGLAGALGAARGRALTVISAADAAARDGYARVPVDDAVHFGGARPLARGPGNHTTARRCLGGITYEPGLLDGFNPGRVVASPRVWAAAAQSVSTPAGGAEAAPGTNPAKDARLAALRVIAAADELMIEPQDLVLRGTAQTSGWGACMAALAANVAADR